jgi:hypothetical protein
MAAHTSNTALEYAMAAFRYREEVTRRKLPCDPDWGRVMREAIKPALAGERGKTDQEQCAFQAIRLTLWESGLIQLPWSKAFLPAPTVAVVWYRRWWNKVVILYRSFLKRINDIV